MKSIKYTIIATCIGLIALYFFNNDSQSTEVQFRPINQATFQSTEPKNKAITKTKVKTNEQKQALMDEVFVEENPVKTDENTTKPEIDYITAYRDWQYFANCYTDIEDFQNDRDPLQTLAERFDNNPRENQTEPTAQQNMYYQQHVDICKTLIQEVGDEREEDNYYQIMSKLEKRFNKITPKTEQGKQLKHALEMVDQLENFKQEYLNSTYPVSYLSDLEKNVINQRIQELTDLVIQVYENSNELSEQQTQLINQYSDEIEGLRKELTNSQTINRDEMNKRQQQVDGYLNSIDDYLHRVDSPDAFLILAKKLYESDYFQRESTVLKKLKAKTGINDSYYIRILNRLVLPLVACSMNYPCDPQSDYMMSYCLGLRDSMFNQACGKNLTDFYFNFYIGMNQMSDVDNYFNYLVSRYAN